MFTRVLDWNAETNTTAYVLDEMDTEERVLNRTFHSSVKESEYYTHKFLRGPIRWYQKGNGYIAEVPILARAYPEKPLRKFKISPNPSEGRNVLALTYASKL